MGAALDQGQQPQLGVTGALLPAEGLRVGRGVRHVQGGAVPGHDPPPEREDPGGTGLAQRPAQALEQQVQGLDAQALAGFGDR